MPPKGRSQGRAAPAPGRGEQLARKALDKSRALSKAVAGVGLPEAPPPMPVLWCVFGNRDPQAAFGRIVSVYGA